MSSRPFRFLFFAPRFELDRLFHALDSNKSGRISFDDFVVGLAVCCRGSLEEKMRFLFGVYDMNEVHLYHTSLASICTSEGWVLDEGSPHLPNVFPTIVRCVHLVIVLPDMPVC